MKNLLKKYNWIGQVKRLEIYDGVVYVMANTAKTIREEVLDFEIPQVGFYNKEGGKITREEYLRLAEVEPVFSVRETEDEGEGQINIQLNGNMFIINESAYPGYPEERTSL